MFCPKCEMYICDTCNPSHISNVFTRNHKREQHDPQNSTVFVFFFPFSFFLYFIVLCFDWRFLGTVGWMF